MLADDLGRPLMTPTIREQSWFDSALEQAGLRSMTIHDLRHTAASFAISSGANVEAVQRMLGHAPAAMTLDVHADLFDDDLDAVPTRLDHADVSTDVVKMESNADRPGADKTPGRFQNPGIPGQ